MLTPTRRETALALLSVRDDIGLVVIPQEISLPQAVRSNAFTFVYVLEVPGTSPAILYINLPDGESPTGYAWKELIRGGIVTNSGTGTILNATTSIAVTHGLDITPNVQDIIITLAENPTNDPGNIWVDTIGATTFTVNCRNDPGASNLDFGWRVISP